MLPAKIANTLGAARQHHGAGDEGRSVEANGPVDATRQPIRSRDIVDFFKLPALPPIDDRDPYWTTALADIANRATHASLSRVTAGLSPAALWSAYFDWLAHLSVAPGKQMQLNEKALRKSLRLQRFMANCLVSSGQAEPCIEPLRQDHRFRASEWQEWPFNALYQSHLLAQQWWHVATTDVPGVSAHHERILEFAARQFLDVFSPSNFAWTNPEILAQAQKTGGQNFIQGWQNLLEDWERYVSGKPPVGAEQFRPGREVAVTPGKVVFRNHLIELIQYEPVTETVKAEPILIVPAWIMKYYILDLSPENSMVRYLVQQGYTVFAISWKNPGPEDRDVSLDDYRRLGVMDAIATVQEIVPDTKLHAMGYCLGGTLLAIAASAIAKNKDTPFATLTFLAAQIDFEEPGELQLFIDESQLRFLEDMMWEQGYLDTKQMAGAFQLLRSNDLVWSRNMREYLMGERTPMFDLMAWNADPTRMPYRMHSEYLRQLYLNNDLAEGRFEVDGRPVSITDIREPLFVVGTERDHIAPWRSVYKWHHLSDTEVTFVLANGGHNAGIVSEPGHSHRHYRMSTSRADDFYVPPDEWAATMPRQPGSWWPAWIGWLGERSREGASPPPLGGVKKAIPALCDAPGTYVHQR
jgi:polyhydroxyalkanoate synthase